MDDASQRKRLFEREILFHRSPTINVIPNAISFLDKDTVTTLCQKANVSSQQLDAFVLTDLHRKVATDAAQVDLMDSVRQISWQEWRVLVSELLRGDAGHYERCISMPVLQYGHASGFDRSWQAMRLRVLRPKNRHRGYKY